MQISLTEASPELVRLVEAALQGEEIVILKDNQPIVKLIPAEPEQKHHQVKAGSLAARLTPMGVMLGALNAEPEQKRRPAKAGSARGQVWMAEDFDEPLEDFKEYME